jgi:hypothetical protein
MKYHFDFDSFGVEKCVSALKAEYRGKMAWQTFALDWWEPASSE